MLYNLKDSEPIYTLIGAGIFNADAVKDTSKLKPLKFDEGFQSDGAPKLALPVREKLHILIKMKKFETVQRKTVPKGAKIFTTTWTLKLKADA